MYRESFEHCPRCDVMLEDARSARACRNCGGLWLDEAVLDEMVRAMRPARSLDRLELAVVTRAEPPIACPSCNEPMEATTLHDLPIDRCAKHGVWFDKSELEMALRRVAELGIPPRPPAPPVPMAEPPAPVQPSARLELVVEVPGQPPRTAGFDQEVIKIGRNASAHLRIEGEGIARLHAVIELAGPGEARIIDLGADAGTIVNGSRRNVIELHVADEIRIGDCTLRVTRLV